MLEKNQIYCICHVRYNTTYCIYSVLFIRKNCVKNSNTMNLKSNVKKVLFVDSFLQRNDLLMTQLKCFFKNKSIF
jgi:hypothetical protein